MSNNPTLIEISNKWKLDAKLEHNVKYFYNLSTFNTVLSGDKCYVIGRKGTGKTAIAEHILNSINEETFALKLTFKGYPYNELYGLDNKRYTNPSQYITLWKFIIYSVIAKMFATNENIKPELRKTLQDLYDPEPIRVLSTAIRNWTSGKMDFSILGNSLSYEKRVEPKLNYSWIEITDLLENVILNNIDASKYFIIFDELDDDYKELSDKESLKFYISLITSLFKAVQDIKSIFKGNNILPVIFLRDDIYELITDSDKNKWSDFKLNLEWGESNIKKMLTYRIAKASEMEINNFEKAWGTIFLRSGVKVGTKGRKTIESYEYITRATHLRPRDYIKYIQVCAEEAVSFKFNHIGPSTIKKTDRVFSNYMRDEIVDEISPILPEIKEILQIISQLHKWNFSNQEFKRQYKINIQSGFVTEPNVDFVLRTLYNFSVIGNQQRGKMGNLYFKYTHNNMTLNLNEQLVLHRGLFKSLQIE